MFDLDDLPPPDRLMALRSPRGWRSMFVPFVMHP
jgi:hypothetical protein